jgi:hypothetical protein
MFHSYTKEQILNNIAKHDEPLDKGYTFGQPNDINIGRYRLTDYTISQIDTTSQSVIRTCIDLMIDGRKGYATRIYLNKPFCTDFLLYEIYNARKACLLKTSVKYISNSNNPFCETFLPNSDSNSDISTIFIVDKPNHNCAKISKVIIISTSDVYIKI